jgi:hypothetical protein
MIFLHYFTYCVVPTLLYVTYDVLKVLSGLLRISINASQNFICIIWESYIVASERMDRGNVFIFF